MTKQQATEQLTTAIARVDSSLASYLESQANMWDSYVDPRDAYRGEDGDYWTDIGAGGFSHTEEKPFLTCSQLFQIQSIARVLFRDNEFAKNAHCNRVNYIIGKSHTYNVVGRDESTPQAAIDRVGSVLDTILKVNHWKRRQREFKMRDDRDGETCIRKFHADDGIMRFRFVEPQQIKPPANAQPHQSFGIETLENDCETIVAYHIDGEEVEAAKVQFRKWNTDSSIKRGYPLLFPVRHNLRRAEKLLRNMSMATEIQTAIALIRKHQQATKQAVRSFVSAVADQQAARSGRTDNVRHYPPGSIIDVPAGQDYNVPEQLDPTKTIAALQAELRAVASLLVMPEFMLTSDASNANFSSTMVAEGPAVKNFEAEQDVQIDYDLELLGDALKHAADSGLITHQELAGVSLEAEAPTLSVRDRLQEAQARQIDMGLRILSPQSAAAQINVDYEQEQTNIEAHEDRTGISYTPSERSGFETDEPATGGEGDAGKDSLDRLG